MKELLKESQLGITGVVKISFTGKNKKNQQQTNKTKQKMKEPVL